MKQATYIILSKFQLSINIFLDIFSVTFFNQFLVKFSSGKRFYLPVITSFKATKLFLSNRERRKPKELTVYQCIQSYGASLCWLCSCRNNIQNITWRTRMIHTGPCLVLVFTYSSGVSFKAHRLWNSSILSILNQTLVNITIFLPVWVILALTIMKCHTLSNLFLSAPRLNSYSRLRFSTFQVCQSSTQCTVVLW